MPAHFSSRAGVGAPYQGNDPTRMQLSQSYHPGFVVLSVLISIVGSASTIELLLRRTANRGAWNIGLLIGAGISFGAVSTFAMHYVGNNSITLHLPASQVQYHGNLRIRLSYSPGYTVLSLVISVISMCAAFAVNGLDVEGFLTEWRIRRKTKNGRRPAPVSEIAGTASASNVNKVEKEQKENPIINGAGSSQSLSMIHTPHSSVVPPLPSTFPSPSRTLARTLSPTETSTLYQNTTTAVAIDNDNSVGHDALPKQSPGRTRNPYSSYLSTIPTPVSGRRMSFEEFANSEVGGGTLNPVPLDDVVPALSNFHPRQSNKEVLLEPFKREGNPGLEPTDKERSSDIGEETKKGEGQVQVKPVEAIWSKPHYPPSKKYGDDRGSETSESSHKFDPNHDHDQEEQPGHRHQPTKWTDQIELSKMSRSSIGGSTTDSTIDQELEGKTRWRAVNWWIKELGLRDVTRFEVWKVIIAGTICGFGVVGMHYLGQKSINSIPHVAYSPFLVVVSVLIACVAVTVGLWVLFLVLRPKLKHSLLKRLATSCILGGATSLMHWTAVLGTSYAVNSNFVDTPLKTTQGTTRRLISGLVGGLAIVACLVTVASVSLAHRRMIAHKARRRGVVLAAAIFDEKGHVLVTPDGVLPLYSLGNLDQLQAGHQYSTANEYSSWKSHLTRRFSGTRFDEESLDSSSVHDFDLTNGHPAFVASLRSTWSWKRPGSYPSSSSAFNGGLNNKTFNRRPSVMCVNTENDSSFTDQSISSEESRDSNSFASAFPQNIARSFGSISSPSPRPLKASAGRFLSKFNEAAAILAVELTGSAKNIRALGVLYDRIFTTGFVSFSPTSDMNGPSDTSNTVSRGQLLLLAGRCENHVDRALFNRRGYTFVESPAMCRVMSTVLSVPLTDMLPFVHSLETFTRPKPMVPKAQGRIYVGALAVQPLPFEGLKILLGEADRTNIPMKEFGITLADGSIASSFSQSSTQGNTKRSHLAVSINELGKAIAKLDGLPLEEMLRDASSSFNNTEPNQLRIVLIDSILSIFKRLPQDVLKTLVKSFALCSSIITLSPTSSTTTTIVGESVQIQGQEPSYLVVFRAILPPTIDVSIVGGSFTWEPFRLFKAKNECVFQEARLKAGGDVHTTGAGNANLRPGGQTSLRKPSRVQWGEIRSSQGTISVNDMSGSNGGGCTKDPCRISPGSTFSESFSLSPSVTTTPVTPVTIYRPPNILVQSPTADPSEREEDQIDVRNDLDSDIERDKKGEIKAYSDTWLSQLLLVRGVNV